MASAGDIIWPLADHLGTIRDLVTYDSGADDATVANHREYDSYGNLTNESNSAVDLLFGYTSRPFDETAGLQNNLNRWYDPNVGRWISEDPIGFQAGDANLSRYVDNSPVSYVDANGTIKRTRVGEMISADTPIRFSIDWTFELGKDHTAFLEKHKTTKIALVQTINVTLRGCAHRGVEATVTYHELIGIIDTAKGETKFPDKDTWKSDSDAKCKSAFIQMKGTTKAYALTPNWKKNWSLGRKANPTQCPTGKHPGAPEDFHLLVKP